VLILDEPTRDVDVAPRWKYTGSSANGDSGIGVLVISSELPEVIGLCNRVLVMPRADFRRALGEDITEKHQRLRFTELRPRTADDGIGGRR